MRVVVNGDVREVPAETTVDALLEALDVAPEGVAVAVDRVIVPRTTFRERRLAEGEQVEILRAVGGG